MRGTTHRLSAVNSVKELNVLIEEECWQTRKQLLMRSGTRQPERVQCRLRCLRCLQVSTTRNRNTMNPRTKRTTAAGLRSQSNCSPPKSTKTIYSRKTAEQENHTTGQQDHRINAERNISAGVTIVAPVT